MRTMYDSTTPGAIPADAGMVAGYVGSIDAWSDADWARFPNATKVEIVINPADNLGHVLDIEPGNWPAVYAVDWVLGRRASGLLTPAVYCGKYNSPFSMQDVLNAFSARGVDPPLFWLASWFVAPVIPAGCIALQYGNASTVGFNADISVVADYWPGVDPDPAPVPDPQPVDPASALNRIIGGRALLSQADAEFAAAQEDLTP